MEAKLQSLRSHGARSPLGLRSLPTAAHDQLAELQARGAEERRRREPAPEPEPLWAPRALPETTPEQLAGRRAATDRLAARVVAGEPATPAVDLARLDARAAGGLRPPLPSSPMTEGALPPSMSSGIMPRSSLSGSSP